MEMMAALVGRQPPPAPTATDTIVERLHYVLVLTLGQVPVVLVSVERWRAGNVVVKSFKFSRDDILNCGNWPTTW
jgi:hypothetical protein